MRTTGTRTTVAAVAALALALTGCGDDGDTAAAPTPGVEDDPATTPTADEADDEAEDEPEPTEEPTETDGDPQALAEDWDAGTAVRVTYRYEADFHETDEPATMVLSRRDGNESLQWEQGGMYAHVNPDADPPFTCTAQEGGDWECYGGENRPEGYQLERSFLGEDQELLAALADGSTDEVAGRDVLCAEVDDDGLQGTICADVETGVMMRVEGETPDGAVAAEATDFGEPTDADFEPPAEVQEL